MKDNDYSSVERKLRPPGGGISTCTTSPRLLSCNIIIPYHGESEAIYYTLAALAAQDVGKSFMREHAAIILVNDGTINNIEPILRRIGKDCPITYVGLRKNLGRSATRNIGIALSQCEVLIFVDADTIVQPTFIRTHLEWHVPNDNVVITGLRDNISLRNIKERFYLDDRANLLPRYEADFRWQRYVPLSWRKDFPEVDSTAFDTSYRLLEQTDNFKQFGFYKTVGVWQLPYMVLSSNMSVRRAKVTNVGGFSTFFRGWGMEDTHLAAKLIADGCYVIPDLRLTTYHVAEAQSEVEQSIKRAELKRNLAVYRRCLLEPLRRYAEAEWTNRMRESLPDLAYTASYS